MHLTTQNLSTQYHRTFCVLGDLDPEVKLSVTGLLVLVNLVLPRSDHKAAIWAG
jgi:hypothetical protein